MGTVISRLGTAKKFFPADRHAVNIKLFLARKQLYIFFYNYSGKLIISASTLDAEKVFIDKHFIGIIYALIKIYDNKCQPRQRKYAEYYSKGR